MSANIWHPKQVRRVARLERFEAATGEKYCHAELVMLGMMDEDGEELESRKDGVRRTSLCKRESAELGMCWCGKFRNGEYQRPEAIESGGRIRSGRQTE